MLIVVVLIASLAFVALVVAAIPVLLQIARTARAAEQALTTLEREVRPLASQLQALLQEHQGLAEQATCDLRKVGDLVGKGQEVVARAARITQALSGLGTVGRVVGIAHGLRRGTDVFFERLMRRR